MDIEHINGRKYNSISLYDVWYKQRFGILNKKKASQRRAGIRLL